MATITRDLWPGSYALPSSNYAAPAVIPGTNFSFPALLFDDSSEESAFFPFRAHNYGSGNLTLDVEWYADTASSGDVVFAAQVAAITPNSDATDIETKAIDTASTATDTHLGTTDQRLHRTSITITNVDALVAGDLVWIKLYRTTVGNTLTGDAIVIGVTLSYSDV